MFDLDPTSEIGLYSLVWLALLLFSLWQAAQSQHGSVGLPLAFIASYTASHVGALVHLVDGYSHYNYPYLAGLLFRRETVASGVETSLLAMIAANIGFVLGGKMMGRRPRSMRELPLKTLRRGSHFLVALGFGFVVIETVLPRIGVETPGLQAVVSSARNLLLVGACGILLHSYAAGREQRSLLLAILMAVSVPAIYLVMTAILADSTGTAVAILAFFVTLSRPDRKVFARNIALFAGAMAVAFIFATGYLQYRHELRSVVSADGSVGRAIETIVDSASRVDLTALVGNDALALLDGRLNQNIFIGLAIEKLELMPDTYENGATIGLALLGWVPRVIWPDKPERGGSRFLTKHTGKVTAEGTTFGAGPIFEFYVNFANAGVAIGFLILGVLVKIFDVLAVHALYAGLLSRVAQFQLAGFALINPLADLFFIVTGVAVAFLIGWALNRAWRMGVPG